MEASAAQPLLRLPPQRHFIPSTLKRVTVRLLLKTLCLKSFCAILFVQICTPPALRFILWEETPLEEGCVSPIKQKLGAD